MNAILRRELIALLRTRRAAAVQLGVTLAFALLIVLRWPTEAQVGLSGAGARQVLDVFGYSLLTSIVLLVPAFPATSLVRERTQGTLALLLNTPLKPWSIYAGKLLGTLALVAILLATTAPAAAACYALGGTSLTREKVLFVFLAIVLFVTLVVNFTFATLTGVTLAYLALIPWSVRRYRTLEQASLGRPERAAGSPSAEG